ncbi:3-dehydroquinate synthase [Coraliomargarita sinensis]|uniref:3-dehydroquinate synthase n=1 Tax=Coraliomargarita sinensis TaxID=2174842 RepID=A0A317ZDI1_9BACT|nr:3-dehydroquinate synthase [Coraliomargarita sinensis]PXA03374.1 3-dehydroquinate synthase [Coraliomargarita sinensis]
MDESPHSIVEEFKVAYSHRVYFTEGVFAPGNSLLASTIKACTSAETPRVFLVADAAFMAANPEISSQITQFFEHCRGEIQYLGSLELPGGEQLKNHSEYLEQLYRVIEQNKLCRHSYIIALGGGALLDLVGYAASTAHRGIRHLRLPTTSLSQGDGGCGVKNGINYFGKKNFLGTFTPPAAVINDVNFLKSLPEARLIDGFIEAIKVALIKDCSFFDYIEENAVAIIQRDFGIIRKVLEASARHHVLHIARNGDPFELTSSRPLDFGHWSAHKLEVLTDYALSHGESVAIGIALDSIYSHRKGYLSEAKLQRILKLIQSFGFRIYDERLSELTEDGQYVILRGLEEFREHMGGKLTIPLLRDIGDQFEVNDMDGELLIESIESLRSWETTLQT